MPIVHRNIGAYGGGGCSPQADWGDMFSLSECYSDRRPWVKAVKLDSM